LLQELSSIPSVKTFQPLDTGLLVSYEGSKSLPYTLIRADIDALPISSDSPGIVKASHLCGHDVHTAILWGILKKAIDTMPEKNILFLFQPGEESGDGARRILQSNILKKWPLKNCFALHVHDAYPLGTIATNKTTLFAASQEIDIIFQGVQGHIAYPEKGIDAWKACTCFCSQWDQVKTCKDSFLGIGRVVAGVTRNIIPAEATMLLTARASSIEKRQEVLEQIQRIVGNIEKQQGIKGSILKHSSCPPVQNDPLLYETSCRVLNSTFPVVTTDMVWAAEDFGTFSSQFPSFMFWLGTHTTGIEKVGLHHPDFYPHDDAISYGIQAFSCLLEL
ncbi:MAG: amidohydrolase, partial [Caldisericia bacterium]|nr:amidohydrolase [Caldisericia bacterium]